MAPCVGEQQEENNLPSTKIYEAFDGSTHSIGCGSSTEWKQILYRFTYFRKYRDIIERGLCYARLITKADEPLYNELCPFLFYWIVHKIKENLEGDQYIQATTTVHNLLQKLKPRWNCSKIYSSMGEHIFKKSKELFDYNYNWRVLTKQGGKNKYCCTANCRDSLRTAADAYRTLESVCGGDEGTPYCGEFNTKRNQWNPKELPELNCYEESEDKLITEKTATATGPLTKWYLSQLPSREAYLNFDFNWKTHCNHSSLNSIKSSIKTVLQEHTYISSCTNKIVCAWYYMNKIMSNNNPSYGQRCEYFYYWLGYLLYKKLKTDIHFPKVINEFYSTLQKLDGNNKCPTINTTIDRTIFERRKKAYDYLNNYDRIKEQLSNSESRCSKKYDDYLKEAHEAYQMMEENCATDTERGGDDPCCKLLNGEKGGVGTKPNPSELSKLTCNVENVPGEESGPDSTVTEVINDCSSDDDKQSVGYADSVTLNEEQGAGEMGVRQPAEQRISGGPLPHGDIIAGSGPITPGSNTRTNTVVSSVLGVGGLASIVFLLYKFTSAFSVIRNTFGGNNRKKRFAGQDLNAYSDDFTENSVENWTIPSESDLTEYSTSNLTETSPLYGRQPQGRNRSNTKHNRNILYHCM